MADDQSSMTAAQTLTAREREILVLVCAGLSLEMIARQLHRSRKTIATHRLSLGRKLGAHNRVELLNNAMRLGLIPAPPVSAEATDQAGVHHLKTGSTDLRLFGPIGNWNWDLLTHQPHFSDEMYEVIGHPKGSLNLTESGLLVAVHPEDRELLLTVVAKTVRTGGSFSLIHRHLGRDGQTHWALSQASVFCDPSGRPIRLSGTAQRCDPPAGAPHHRNR